MCKQNNLEGRKNVMCRIDLFCYVLAALLAFLGIIISYGIVQRFCDSGNESVGVLCGMATLLLVGLCSISICHMGNTAKKIEDDIKSSLNKNYTGYTHYKHDNTNTFVCDGKKYSFDYDRDTNTLVVFNETGTVIDGTYVDGQKIANDSKTDVNESVLETESESKAVDTSDNTNKEDSAPVSEENSDLNRRIQTTIIERYTDAFITSYDANAVSGTFDAGCVSYKFAWSDNLLEVTEVDNPNSVIYMKIAE